MNRVSFCVTKLDNLADSIHNYSENGLGNKKDRSRCAMINMRAKENCKHSNLNLKKTKNQKMPYPYTFTKPKMKAIKIVS